MKTTLVAVRLGRTREVLRELARSVKRFVPILVGVAGPIAVASLALLAWAGVPPMKAATLPWREGVPLWLAQAVLAAWPLWALRRRLLPDAWCVQLRCLPIPARAMWASDVAVSAALLAPLAALYAVSVLVFAWRRPAWWLHDWPAEVLALAASWAASCALGAAALAWQRRGVVVRAVRALASAEAGVSIARRHGVVMATLWTPWWRGALTPSGWSVIAAMAGALLLALAWTIGAWPVMPGAAWAFLFSAQLVALTERVQRAMESHLAGVGAWLSTLPLGADWRRLARVLTCAPMVAVGAVAVVAVLCLRPWRAVPLAFFAAGLVAMPLVLTGVPAARRETHVGLWSVGVGLLTAFGSELWN